MVEANPVKSEEAPGSLVKMRDWWMVSGAVLLVVSVILAVNLSQIHWMATLSWIIRITGGVAVCAGSYYWLKYKNRSSWYLLCLVTGALGLMVIYFLPVKYPGDNFKKW
jgi:hypothetical protein